LGIVPSVAVLRGDPVLPFGIKELDRHLPGGGLALGALHEVAGGGNDAINGAVAALFAAGIAARTRGKVLWCITRPGLFAPALAQARLMPDRVIYAEAELILRDPSQIPQLLRIAHDAQAAFVALFRSRKLVAGTLGFTDFREFLLDVPAEDVLGGPLQV
jgi:hypothetical protein